MKIFAQVAIGICVLLYAIFILRSVYLKKLPSNIIIPIDRHQGMLKNIYVSPDGHDQDNGSSVKTAFQTIQRALDVASPGSVIHLEPGSYYQDVYTVRDGIPDKPIIVTGPRSAVIYGQKNSHIFEISHRYIELNGFTIDGHFMPSHERLNYRNKLIYAVSKTKNRGVTGVKILNMEIKNAGGECIRFRYFASKNEISGNQITNCGIFDFKFENGGKNGEGIYIGTAPEQTDNEVNPTGETDRSNHNWIHHNVIDTQGNECVDIKEGSSFNIVEYNDCTGQKDRESGGFDSRGNDNTFRNNTIHDNQGAGIRLGGDGSDNGINNDIYENVIVRNQSGGIKFQRFPQGKICGNIMGDNSQGNAVGSYGRSFDLIRPC